MSDLTEKQKKTLPCDEKNNIAYPAPDDMDKCWQDGSNIFTRKEVAYLLYTQRVMIHNDLKALCGQDSSGVILEEDIIEVIEDTRRPSW